MARRNYGTKKRKRRGRLGVVYSFICFVAIGFAVFFTLSIFFKVKTIAVEGVSTVSAESVRSASQILIGDNMFLLNKTTITRNIAKELSYVESVRIRRKLPSTVVIEVEESRAVGALPYGGGYWLFTGSGKLLSSVNEAALPGDIPVVRGVTLLMPQAGAEMALSDSDSDKQAPLFELLGALTAAEMLDNTQVLDISKVFDVRFTYDNRLNIVLGMPVELEYKFRFLDEVLSQRSAHERATVDVSQVTTLDSMGRKQAARVIVEG